MSFEITKELEKELQSLGPPPKQKRWTEETMGICAYLYKKGYTMVAIADIMKKKFPKVEWLDTTILKKLQRMGVKK